MLGDLFNEFGVICTCGFVCPYGENRPLFTLMFEDVFDLSVQSICFCTFKICFAPAGKNRFLFMSFVVHLVFAGSLLVDDASLYIMFSKENSICVKMGTGILFSFRRANIFC